jgi:transcriptional repressor of dcmA and dcmR
MTDADDLLDIGEAAQFLNVSETSLRRWTNAGALSCLRVGGRHERRFRRRDLLAFLERSAAAPRKSARSDVQASVQRSVDEAGAATHEKHPCGIYGSDAGRITLLTPFLLEGLREGSVCVLIGPRRARNEIVKNLEDLRPSLPSDVKDGRLVLADHQKTARAQWKSLATFFNKARKAGASSFRVAGDMIGLRTQVSAAELIAYEAGLDDRIVAKYPVMLLCAYDARKFSGVELLNVLKTHRDSYRFPLGRVLA